MSEPFLFGTVVVGYGRSASGRDALRLAELLARTVGNRVLIVSVTESGSTAYLSEGDLETEGSCLLARSRVPLEFRALDGSSPARVLHELALADNRIGLLALGSTHHASIGGVSPGSVAAKLLSGAPCPVAIAPRDYAGAGGRAPKRAFAGPDGGEPLPLGEEIRVIAVAFDDSPESRAALKLAAMVGLRCEATLRVIAADHRSAGWAASAAAGAATPGSQGFDLQGRLHSAVSDLPRELRALPVFERKRPADALVDQVEAGVDLLVMGSRGYGPLRSVLLGSVSAEVIGRAGCPVLVAPRGSSSA